MSKLTIFLFILFLAALAVFAISNQQTTIVNIPFGNAYETPTIALILLAIAFGAFVMLSVFLVRDTKRYVDSWQYQKKQKRDQKIQELYSKALNYLFSHHNYGEAKELLSQVLIEDPDYLNALLRLGDIAILENDYQTAREYYHRARDLYPKNIEVLFALEKLMEKTERWNDGIRYLDDHGPRSRLHGRANT